MLWVCLSFPLRKHNYRQRTQWVRFWCLCLWWWYRFQGFVCLFWGLPVLRPPNGSDGPASHSPESSVCPSSQSCTWCNVVASSGTTCMSLLALVPSPPPSELHCTWTVRKVDHTKGAYPLATQCSGSCITWQNDVIRYVFFSAENAVTYFSRLWQTFSPASSATLSTTCAASSSVARGSSVMTAGTLRPTHRGRFIQGL